MSVGIPNPTLGSEQVLSRAAVGCWRMVFQHSGIQGTVIRNQPPRNVQFFGPAHAAGAERIHQTQADKDVPPFGNSQPQKGACSASVSAWHFTKATVQGAGRQQLGLPRMEPAFLLSVACTTPCSELPCPSFGWHRLIFLPNSCHGAVFWI